MILSIFTIYGLIYSLNAAPTREVGGGGKFPDPRFKAPRTAVFDLQ